ncbi:uncharacterized protein LOC102077068 [Oreochromis niloticus]|uniref:uncharacterized protein LOC102077068 n=1 Tax=Oreochromis niloticus TaxID=8128 RepID=UPI00067446BC|nr:uncharacterized protein LOC102077068 [Oreochromis niloticus]
MDQTLKEASTDGNPEWLEILKTVFQNGAIAANVLFALIMMAVEKLVELEFECPCEGIYLNGGFVATFFIIPGILAYVLMASLQGMKFSCDIENKGTILRRSIPAFLWAILLLFNGSYITCAMTDWSGTYVAVDKVAPLKWCEPENGTSYQERLKKSQDWYVYSQWAGIAFIVVLILLIIKYILKGQSSPPAQSESLQVPPGQTDQPFGSGSAVPLKPVHTNTPDTNATPM